MTRMSIASLGIYSATHRAEDVTAILGLEPTKMHERGDIRVGKTRRKFAPYRTSAWVFDAGKDKTNDPNDDSGFAAVTVLLDAIGDRGDALAQLRPHYTTAIRWTGEVSPQGNFVIDGELMTRLGRLGCHFYGSAFNEDGVGNNVRIERHGNLYTGTALSADPTENYATTEPLPKSVLIDALLARGWHQQDIGDAFSEADPEWLTR